MFLALENKELSLYSGHHSNPKAQGISPAGSPDESLLESS